MQVAGHAERAPPAGVFERMWAPVRPPLAPSAARAGRPLATGEASFAGIIQVAAPEQCSVARPANAVTGCGHQCMPTLGPGVRGGLVDCVV